jgi:hypothetical protein
VRVVVKRAFLIAGERVEPGSEIDLGESLARELIAVGKCEPLGALAAPGPMTSQTVPALIAGPVANAPAAAGKRKGKSDDREPSTSE